MFNHLCHCRACSRARSMSPVHIMGISNDDFTWTKGEEHLTVAKGQGKMIHGFCSLCGTALYQHPDGARFKALFPVCFHINDPEDPKSCILHDELKPTMHANYENRVFDWHDSLPKYKVDPPGPRMENNGDIAADDTK